MDEVAAESVDPLTRLDRHLRATVEGLESPVLGFLAVFVLANDELTVREVTQELGPCQIVDEHGRKPGARWIRTTHERLVEEGLLEETSRYGKPTARTPPEVAILVLEELHARDRLRALVERCQPPQRYYHGHRAVAVMTRLRIALVEGASEKIDKQLEQMRRFVPARSRGDWLIGALGLVPPAALVERLPVPVRTQYLTELMSSVRAAPLAPPERLIEQALELGDRQLRLELGRLMVLRGEGERALKLGGLSTHGARGLSLLAAFWRGDYAAAASIGAEAIAAMKRRKRKVLPDLEGVCHVLASLATSGSDPRALYEIEPVIEAGMSQKSDRYTNAWGLAREIHRALLGDRSGLRCHASNRYWADRGWVELWVAALHDVWLEPKQRGANELRQEGADLLRALADRSQNLGYGPVARELDGVADALGKRRRGGAPANEAPSLARAFRAPAPWETALVGLDAIVAGTEAAPEAEAESERHLVWELKLHAGCEEITPRLRESSRARKGKVVSLSRLLAGKEDDALSEDDRQVLAAAELEEQSDGYHGVSRGRGSMVLGAKALVALIGHPRVVDGEGKPLKVERGQATITTRRKGGQVRVKLTPSDLAVRRVHCEKHGGRVRIYERTPELERAADILGPGLDVPGEGVERLLRTLGRLSVAAGVEIAGDLEPEAQRVEADPRPVLLLEWDGECLGVQARVAPLGLAGAQLRPGVGNPVLAGELREGGELRLLRCERELDEEMRCLAELEQACPTLMSYGLSPLHWRVAELTDALEVMLELQCLGDAVVPAWPKGRRLGAPLERDVHDLKLAVSSGKDWLSVDASLRVDEGAVLSFRELIEARAGPRFVKLGEDRFVALSEQLRRRLDALENVATRKGSGLRAAPAMLPMLDELAADLDAPEFDNKALAKLAEIRKLADTVPRRPRGLAATLRDYQKQGYDWMWRLAEAGLGACLADDMGLGKTVQALALLSQRARKGPALVVCPTSVVSNWLAETERFAPSLRPSALAEAGDRAAALEQLRARDLLVCSYGVLASEAEALAEVEFATVVFDEAHALKNERTKRAKAARGIQAGFRLGLTGTPVENRVDELWSLFRVLVPGLLGSKAKFEERFAKAIARGDRERAGQLRALLRHFILRRTKAQVLDELPARTEITLRVTPTSEERAYYEALRRRAVDAVEAGDPRKKRFRILAQITRLRQAAVDPRLVDEHAAPAGAKVEALVEQLLALREEGHRALVFTQFLGSMALVRARLEAAGVEYLELDGSTPAAERGRRVDAFQSGEGDVFLLSLRAGGVGMNLTGADYVLHLDPWWNPAVEDQATDRAHRIGQMRPVTVYRLISEGTIEDKILGLHERKRELADDILTGLEGAETLDLDKLMGLLAG
jgi:superfamily II DNA or RNA helicase